MDMRSLLEVAGENSLYNFPWATDVVATVNVVLPDTHQLSIEQTGAEALALLDATGEAVKKEVFAHTFDLTKYASRKIADAEEAVLSSKTARGLKAKAIIGVIAVVAVVLLFTTGMAAMTAVKTGAPPDFKTLTPILTFLGSAMKLLLGV